jgi:putative alpha-1,2-mannosidase
MVYFQCNRNLSGYPADGNYVFGSPQIKKAILNLGNGNHFVINAEKLTLSENIHYKISLNGKEISGKSISHKAILSGGELTFEMK